MNRSLALPLFVSCLLTIARPAAAAIITAQVEQVSSENVLGLDRDADHAVDGSGLTGGGGAGSTHSEGESGIAWTSVGSLGPGTDYDPFITFDLGARHDVTAIREWGYNAAFQTFGTRMAKVGPKDVDVYTSADGSAYSFAETVTFAFAPGANGYTGNTLSVNYTGVRYIKFDIRNNHDGAVFDGTGKVRGGDGRSLTGLSEVRFEGALTPPPAAAPGNPGPADAATGLEPDISLSWDANDTNGAATGYCVFLGVGDAAYNYLVHTATVPASASPRLTSQPPAQVVQKGSRFWWRVEKLTAAGPVSSPVWTFGTRPETTAEKDARMAWFRQGKVFGAIVWGLYSGAEGVWPPQTGTKNPSWTYAEWIQFWKSLPSLQYRDELEPYLTGAQFDAAQMAHLCKEAGMELVYVMPRHHDGYAIWNTATTTTFASNGFKIANSPYNPSQRDYLKELVDALRAEGLRVGFYFSLGDWHHPDFPRDGSWAHPQQGQTIPGADWSRYVNYLHQQVREIVDPNTGTDYGPFDVVYFDYSTDGINGEEWGATKLVHMVRRYHPNIIINNRLWNGLNNTNGDFATPEANVDNIGYNEYDRDWEAIMSANDPPTWGYGRPDLYPFKSAADLVWDIVDVASKGGTIELSVSPKGDGSLHPDQLSQYAGLGAWMASNAASIKGTTGNPVGSRPAWGEYTSKQSENRLFLHVFNRPADGNIVASGLYGAVGRAWLLTNPAQSLAVTSRADGFQVSLPSNLTHSIDTVIVVDYAFPPPPTTTTTVAAVSSENVLGLDRAARHTVDSSGFVGGRLGPVHAEGENGVVWTTVGSIGPGTDYDPFITFDLGGIRDICAIREWGYNAAFLTFGSPMAKIGPKDVEVYGSVDGTNFSLAGAVRFALAPATNGYLGNTVAVHCPGVRFIKLDIRSNHDGAVFDGTGTQRGGDGRSLTGLSEIRFVEGPPGSPVRLSHYRLHGASLQVRADGLDLGRSYRLTRALDPREAYSATVDGPRAPMATVEEFMDPAPPSGGAFYRTEEAP